MLGFTRSVDHRHALVLLSFENKADQNHIQARSHQWIFHLVVVILFQSNKFNLIKS